MPDPIDIILCCANACGRIGTDDGPCAAGDYGRKRREALEAAGYAVVPANAARGCICPPGAEATCNGWNCPRRPTPQGSAA